MMLACLQRPNQPDQHLTCATEAVRHQSELSSTRYPSAAELDAFAQRTADSPLSIKIFPTNVRVPQHKQINRTVNGLDTSGQLFSSYSHTFPAGYQGLLAIAKTPSAAKGVLKSSEGRRSKLSPVQMAVAPYMPPSSRHRQKPYNVGLCKAPEGPHVVMAASAVSERPAHSIIPHMSRPSNSSPAFLAATAASCSDSGFSAAGLFSGAVLPTQSADVAKAAGFAEGLDYWQHKHRAQPHYTQGSVRMSPEVCVPLGNTQLPYRSHTLSAGAGLSSSPLNCTAVHGDFSVTQFFAPPWNAVLATDSDSYNQQELPNGSSVAHPPFHPLARGHQLYPGRGLCYGLPGKSLCQASLLSSSLQSLECLISEIHPPCIKERMLGRGYDVMGVAGLLDPQGSHIQLPVLR